MTLTIRRVESADDLSACLNIRHAVFVIDQNVPADLEYDGKEDACAHYLALDGKTPVATARIMTLDNAYKFQRVAVIGSHQGKGIGARLMRFMMDDLISRDDAIARNFILSSQVQAIPFYEKLGFEVCSDVYMDAGIEHRDMRAEI